MQAIILAEGMGKRLKDLTQNNTKCMVRVNGVTMIERMLHHIFEIPELIYQIRDDYRFYIT